MKMQIGPFKWLCICAVGFMAVSLSSCVEEWTPAEKEAKRSARKLAAEQRAQQAAEGGVGVEDPIQAAIDRAKAKKAAQQSGGSDSGNELDKLQNAVANIQKRLAT